MIPPPERQDYMIEIPQRPTRRPIVRQIVFVALAVLALSLAIASIL